MLKESETYYDFTEFGTLNETINKINEFELVNSTFLGNRQPRRHYTRNKNNFLSFNRAVKITPKCKNNEFFDTKHDRGDSLNRTSLHTFAECQIFTLQV